MRASTWLVAVALALFVPGAIALADGPSGSSECHLHDDDCDGQIDEDTGGPEDDDDGDGLIDEDPVDGEDNDGDGLVDEDPADDDGDGLVDEDPVGDATDDGENEVTCGDGEDVAGVIVYTDGESSLEACNDGGNPAAPQGRVIATTQDGGYLAIDGDASNPAPANGYARVDEGGVHCGDANNQDATADQSENTVEDCNTGEAQTAATGPSGSTETDNQVDCNESTSEDVAGAQVHASEAGVEVCNEGASPVPVEGRAIVTPEQGGYAAIDGDDTNPEPSNGYARVDADGVHCGDETNQDSTVADQSGNTIEDCG